MDRKKTIAKMRDIITNDDVAILVNQQNPKQHLVVNIKTGDVVDVVWDTLKSAAKGADDVTKEKLKNKDWHALFGFNPYDNRVVWQAEEGWLHYNQFQQPAHSKEPREVSKLPAVFDDFLTFLFGGNEDAKSHMLDVLATMLVRRVETIPCLVGAGGIGKNTLVEHFLPLLVGPSNHVMARQHDIKSNFSSWSENKQVIVYDEVKLTDELTVNTIKSRTNETVVIEAKGQDRRQVRNYATSFILSNSVTALGQFLDDRRASIYPLTETPLKDADWLLEAHGGSVDSLRSLLLASNTVAEVYWYLRGRNVGVLTEYKDPSAYKQLKSATTSAETEFLTGSVEAHLRAHEVTTLGQVLDAGWTNLSCRKLSSVLRAAADHRGKLFIVGSGHDRATDVRLARPGS